ncbi:MAG TPA: hypothetical protein VEZ50_21115, partial [Nodosilinea sp.]|nr:hypothetical protein [Nodosilinea sp.]
EKASSFGRESSGFCENILKTTLSVLSGRQLWLMSVLLPFKLLNSELPAALVRWLTHAPRV